MIDLPRGPINYMRCRVDGGEAREFKGRDAWTLEALISAGAKGCTPIERPAPRWSEYVRRLREAGIAIETERVPHGGAYAGQHGIYKLRCKIEVLEIRAAGDEAEAA